MKENKMKTQKAVEKALSSMKSDTILGVRVSTLVKDLEGSNTEAQLSALDKVAFLRKQAEAIQTLEKVDGFKIEDLKTNLTKKVKRVKSPETALVNPAFVLDKGIVYVAEGGQAINKEDQLQQVGIDLRLAKAYKVQGHAVLAVDKKRTETPQLIELQLTDGFYLFKAGNLYSIDFIEDVKVPENMAGFVKHRSTINRTIGTIESGVYDPGFESKGGCGATFRPNTDVKIEVGFRCAQIIFYTASSANLYNGQYQRS